jgi:hypothetical protein
MEIKKITLEIPRCHDIVTAETSKSRKLKFLRRHESIWTWRYTYRVLLKCAAKYSVLMDLINTLFFINQRFLQF